MDDGKKKKVDDEEEEGDNNQLSFNTAKESDSFLNVTIKQQRELGPIALVSENNKIWVNNIQCRKGLGCIKRFTSENHNQKRVDKAKIIQMV